MHRFPETHLSKKTIIDKVHSNKYQFALFTIFTIRISTPTPLETTTTAVYYHEITMKQ